MFEISRSLAQQFFSLKDLPLESNEEDGLSRPHLIGLSFILPVCGHTLGLETTSITNSFNDTSHERSTVQLTHLSWNTDVTVDQWLIVTDHILGWIRCGSFESISSSSEEMTPESGGDELKQS
jgi:hypothetical protein